MTLGPSKTVIVVITPPIVGRGGILIDYQIQKNPLYEYEDFLDVTSCAIGAEGFLFGGFELEVIWGKSCGN